jgi:hypothetical protein
MFVTQVGVSELRYVPVSRLETIHEVTGKEFPVSGDAPQRMKTRMLKQKMDREAAIAKMIYSGMYGKVPTYDVNSLYPNIVEPLC